MDKPYLFPTRGPAAAHAPNGKDLVLESFAEDEARYLAHHLGKKNPPEFAGAGSAAGVAWTMQFCKETMDKKQVSALKKALGKMHPGKPVAPPEPEPEPEEPKGFDLGDLPVSAKAQDALRDAGLLTPEDIVSEGLDGLIALPSVGKTTAKKILDALGG